MNRVQTFLPFAFLSQTTRGVLWHALLPVVAIGVFAALPAHGQSITIPNYSFETPTAAPPASPLVDSWVKTAQPGYFSPASFGGITWDETAGVFPNTAVGQSNHINNLDGNQAGYILTFPGAGVYQDLSAVYTPGKSFSLTVGVLGEGSVGDSLDLILYYRDGSNNMIPLGDTSIPYSSTTFPNINNLVDFSVSTPVVQASDPEAGKAIGVEIVVTQGNFNSDWDVDNARLSAVPEPASAGLFAFGAGALLLRRRRPTPRVKSLP